MLLRLGLVLLLAFIAVAGVLATPCDANPMKLVTVGIPFHLDEGFACKTEAEAREIVDDMLTSSNIAYTKYTTAAECGHIAPHLDAGNAVVLRVTYHRDNPKGGILKVARLGFQEPGGAPHDLCWIITAAEIIGSGIQEGPGAPV